MIIKERIQRADGSIYYREYLKKDRLGKGGFAECFIAERISDKKIYALKIISKKLLEKPKARQKMLSEIKLHNRAKHKNICDLERAFEDEENVYMLLELCSNGNMFEMIRRRKKLTIPETQFYIYQLIDSLCYLHSRKMIHRDVKLGNLLIDSSMNLKLADFGLTTKLEFQGDLKHTVCGTPNYIAPEIIRSGMGLGASGHSYEVDIWSTGVIMYLMLIGKAPFETSAVEKTYQRISKGQFDFPESFKDQDAKDLLRHILVVDPSKRYTFEQILAHPFMNPKCGIPKELPQISLTQPPKFGVFEKYAQDPVKKSARDASVMTLRSSVDLSMEQDFDGLDTSKHQVTSNEIDSNRKGSKDVKKLLTSVFSTSSLSKSLQKLTDLSRSSSPQSRNVRGVQPQRLTTSNSSSRLNLSANRINQSINSSMMRTSRLDSEREEIEMNAKKKEIGFTYIIEYHEETIWNYRLNNGYVGTYEPNYKIIYNSHDNKYIEIENGEICELKKTDEATNERLNNRKKFLKSYNVNALECEPYMGKERIVFLTKIYKIDKEGLVMFRLSNGYIQAHDNKNNLNLLTNEISVVLIETSQGKEISRIMESAENYANFPERMMSLYLKVKKIINSIKNRKTN